jgi:hypothetical protein
MTRLSLVVLAALGLCLGACGDDGGGGDEEAFCETLEALSDQVGDGDLSSNDGLEDVNDTVNDLRESAADGEQLEAVAEVGRDVVDADPDDADDTAETIQDELGDFASDCDIDEDDFAVPPTTTTTTSTTTTTTASTTTTTTQGGPSEAVLVSAREPIPGGIAAEFAALAQACFDGDMDACDQLFNTTPSGSIDESYGDTCGGRIEDGRGFELECATVVTGPTDVPPEIVDQAAASACNAGDMVACDDLFNGAAEGSIDRLYGALCAGRVQDTDALCVAIFGEVAFA